MISIFCLEWCHGVAFKRVESWHRGCEFESYTCHKEDAIVEEDSGKLSHKIHFPRKISEPCIWLLLLSKSTNSWVWIWLNLFHFAEFKKLYFFARAKINPSSLQTHSCFKKNCTGTYSREPDPCPVGYKQKRFSEVCANCSAPFGVYSYRCKCKDWKSCAHRAYSKLNCPDSNPFMQFKVRECVQGNIGFSHLICKDYHYWYHLSLL